MKINWHKSEKKSHILMRVVSLFPHLTALWKVKMLSILRIFKYVRKRLIKLSLENKMLKTQLEYYRAIIESDNNRKH